MGFKMNNEISKDFIKVYYTDNYQKDARLNIELHDDKAKFFLARKDIHSFVEFTGALDDYVLIKTINTSGKYVGYVAKKEDFFSVYCIENLPKDKLPKIKQPRGFGEYDWRCDL